MKRAVTALAASLVALAAHAIAQDIPTEQQILHACGSDVRQEQDLPPFSVSGVRCPIYLEAAPHLLLLPLSCPGASI